MTRPHDYTFIPYTKILEKIINGDDFAVVIPSFGETEKYRILSKIFDTFKNASYLKNPVARVHVNLCTFYSFDVNKLRELSEFDTETTFLCDRWLEKLCSKDKEQEKERLIKAAAIEEKS